MTDKVSKYCPLGKRQKRDIKMTDKAKWQKYRVWKELYNALRDTVRKKLGRSTQLTEIAADSQQVI